MTWTCPHCGTEFANPGVRILTVREREILQHLVDGHSNAHIADELILSINTVRTHVWNLVVKLGVHSKLAAVAWANANGMRPSAAAQHDGAGS